MEKFIAVFLLYLGLFIPSFFAQSYSFNIDKHGQGDPLILIPGLSSDGSVWDATVDSLKKDFTCYVLTLPGFAQQPPIEFEDQFLPLIQQEITNLIKGLDKQATLMGHSLGGFMSMSIAAHEPELVKKVIVVDSYPFYSAAMNPAVTQELAEAQAKMFKAQFLNMSDSIYAAQQKMTMSSMVTAPKDAELATLWSIQSDRKTVAQAMYELMTTDLRPKVSDISCPVLVLGSWYAAKDYGITAEMVKGNYTSQLSGVKECQIMVAPTAKHFIMWDQPAWFMEKVSTFLK
ncbi:MAG: alpha/beta hydrolase [Bacteroidota bacterium]